MIGRAALALSFAMVIAAAGCDAGVSNEEPVEPVESVESAARDGEVRTAGSYEVPVPSSTDLAGVATNPVRVKLRPVGRDGFRLKYDLPTVIAGADKEVDLVATKSGDRRWTLAGPAGSGTCTESASGEIVCHEILDGVVMSLAEATRAIDATASTPAERAARVEVAERFIIDPLGVLRFSRRR